MQEVPGAEVEISMKLVEPPVRQGRVSHHVRPDGREFPEGVLDAPVFLENAAVRILRAQRTLSEGRS
jgi:hypothetical protein